jgi:hypothetical protein
MPLLGFFHPLLGCDPSLIVAFQEVFQFGINPDKNVKGFYEVDNLLIDFHRLPRCNKSSGLPGFI